MGLLHKPDWDDAKERFLAWWEGEALGRCGLAVTAPKGKAQKGQPPTAPENPLRRWTDLDYIAELNEFQHRNTFYGGEAFPIWHGGYPGHTSIPTFLGCPLTLDMRTGWHEPILNGDTWALDDLALDRDNRYYRFQLDLLQTAAEASRGRSVPSVGAFGGCGDTLAAARGTMRLLTDVIDRPDLVRRTELHLMGMWIEVYSTFYDIVSPAGGGSTCWFPLWSPGRFYAAQCDFSYTISPSMFTDLFVPALERQLEFLDHAVYHVDGVEAFRHVPQLCDLPRLQALQILPGAGKPSPLHYLPVLREVQARGKNLHITIPAHEVEPALRELSARGLFIATSCETETEARALLAKVEGWSHD
jgi:hypothetical protein